MPRVYHRKSAGGCVRCKKRRVKCDEAKPECGACQRHQVSCHYRSQSQKTRSPTARLTEPSASIEGPAESSSTLESENSSQPKVPNQEGLELALLHYFLTETINTFHDPIVLWKTRLPLVGLRCRYVLDALLSLAALDLYRHTYTAYGSLRNATCGVDADQANNVHSLSIENGCEKYLLGHSPWEMQRISHVYFESAIEGHRKAVQDLGKENFESAFLASLAIYMISLYALACPHEDENIDGNTIYDEKLWFSLGTGMQEIVRSWNQFTGKNALKVAGYFNMVPDFTNEEELFHERHRDVFSALLSYGKDFELTTTTEDRTYEQAVSFIGLMYNTLYNSTLCDDSEPIRFVASYIASFAGKVRSPFGRLVAEGRPRALAIVGQLFAIMRLVEGQLPQYKGIAARQIPAICERLPLAWKKAMEWPVSIAARPVGCLDPIPSPPSLEDLNRAQ